MISVVLLCIARNVYRLVRTGKGSSCNSAIVTYRFRRDHEVWPEAECCLVGVTAIYLSSETTEHQHKEEPTRLPSTYG